MNVRSYQEADREACRTLWVELTQWHRDIYAAPQIGGEDPGAAFDEHLARVGPANLWVAEEDGRVVGLSGLIPGESDVELEPVVVSAACRGRGIGRALVEAVIAAAGTHGVTVRPVGRNAEAIRFFHALGFDVVARVELLRDSRDLWQTGERVAGREFRV